jgi:hypothetical protein
MMSAYPWQHAGPGGRLSYFKAQSLARIATIRGSLPAADAGPTRFRWWRARPKGFEPLTFLSAGTGRSWDQARKGSEGRVSMNVKIQDTGILLERARWIVAGGQQALDIEVAARAQSMADVADYPNRPCWRCCSPKRPRWHRRAERRRPVPGCSTT